MFFRKKITQKPFRSAGLYIAPSGDDGRGLFSSSDIKAGEIVERAPLMLCKEADTATMLAPGQMFAQYLFRADVLSRDICPSWMFKNPSAASFYIMGAALYCNDSKDANVKHVFTGGGHTAFCELTAIRDIPKDTELFADAAPYRHEDNTAGPRKGHCAQGQPTGNSAPAPLFLNENLYLDTIKDKGRGVFCSEDIKKGEQIEICPLMMFDDTQVPTARETEMNFYIFTTDPLGKDAFARTGAIPGGRSALLAVGMLSFCNHLHVPNADEELMMDGATPRYRVIAKKDIPKNTEICITYGIGWLTNKRMLEQIKAADRRKREKE